MDQVAQVGPQLFCRFTILATKADGTEIGMPCVTVIELADGLITDYAARRLLLRASRVA